MAGVAKFFNGRIHDRSYKNVDLYDRKYLGHVFGLYFGAQCCPPCQSFTPILTDLYEEIHPEKKVKIIYISTDHDEQSFHQYYRTMPWLALDYRDWKRRGDLLKSFKVDGIPKLVLIDGDSGRILSAHANDKITNMDMERKYLTSPTYFQNTNQFDLL